MKIVNVLIARRSPWDWMWTTSSDWERREWAKEMNRQRNQIWAVHSIHNFSHIWKTVLSRIVAAQSNVNEKKQQQQKNKNCKESDRRRRVACLKHISACIAYGKKQFRRKTITEPTPTKKKNNITFMFDIDDTVDSIIYLEQQANKFSHLLIRLCIQQIH